MKVLPYLLAAGMLSSGIDLFFAISAGNLYACPRCRKAQPKGPRKRPHPGFPKKIVKEDSPQNTPKESAHEQK